MQPLAGVARTWTRLPLLLDNTSQDGAGRFSDTMSAAYAILALQDDEATPPSHLWPVEEDSQARDADVQRPRENSPQNTTNLLRMLALNQDFDEEGGFVTAGSVRLYATEELPATAAEKATVADLTGDALAVVLNVPSSPGLGAVRAFFEAVQPTLQRLDIFDTEGASAVVCLRFVDTTSRDAAVRTYAGQPWPGMEEHVCHAMALTGFATVHERQVTSKLLQQRILGPQLPTCVACLSRLDETVRQAPQEFPILPPDANGCMACRALQSFLDGQGQECVVCGVTAGLWACLCCGHVACGRYQFGQGGDHTAVARGNCHSLAHFEDTGRRHAYSLELSTGNRIWAYTQDRYVHRVGDTEALAAAGKNDGEESAAKCAGDGRKMVDMEDEFSRLLAHQLLSQDRFFAERVATAEKTCRETVAGLGVEAEAVQRRLEATRRELSEMRDRRLAATARGATVAGEFEALLAAFRDVTKARKASLQASQPSRERLAALRAEEARVDADGRAEIASLRAEIVDLNAHLSHSAALAGVSDETRKEVQAGSLHIVAGPEKPGSRRKRGGGKRK